MALFTGRCGSLDNEDCSLMHFLQEKKNVANLLMAYKLAANNTTPPLNHPTKTTNAAQNKQAKPQKQTSKDKAAQCNWPVLACVTPVFTP